MWPLKVEATEQREHSHFFTADGSVGSRDDRGQQVDDGRYELVGDDVVVINGSSFHYRIDGNSLYLTPDPVDTSDCTSRMCRFEPVWVLTVAMPGMPWTRGVDLGRLLRPRDLCGMTRWTFIAPAHVSVNEVPIDSAEACINQHPPGRWLPHPRAD